MIQKLSYTTILLLLVCGLIQAQSNTNGSTSDSDSSEDSFFKHDHDHDKKKAIPSIIKNWELNNYGASLVKAELDTALNFFHDYQPCNKISFSNTTTRALGGGYISNNFFKREHHSDFYFLHSFDTYVLTPDRIKYFNTTTPYSFLEYSQSENKSLRTESRFNAFFTQNINPETNIGFFYYQGRSKGYYDNDDDDDKYNNIGLFGSYQGEKLVVHGNVIFNRVKTEEDGGVVSGQDLNDEDLNLNLSDAYSSINSNVVHLSGEYRIGKFIEEEDEKDKDFLITKFIPRTGFIYDVEISGNERTFEKEDVSDDYFEDIYLNEEETNDITKYTRFSNVFQIKFYEAPDRKYSFGKRAYIGHDRLWYTFPEMDLNITEYTFNIPGSYTMPSGASASSGYMMDVLPNLYYQFETKKTNTYWGGAIYRSEGKFWQWNAGGKMYLNGYKAGQTELNGYINKPLKIGKDTTSLRVEGNLNTLVPDYFQKYYISNHFRWENSFNNINEMTVKGTIRSQLYKLSMGANYSLIDNYIYNGADALPTQASGELLVVSAWLDKDFESKHWLVRSRLLWQSVSQPRYLHLPDFATYLSMNYRTIISKVMHAYIGVDARYTTKFYADAFEPATGRFYWQNEEKIGNYPFVDLHISLKLKRTRAFFNLMNATSGLLDGNFWSAPSYPLYKRTFRFGLSWSFYD